MRAVTWHGKRDVRVETVPDPTLKEPTDAIIRVTSSGICGSDLHLYEVMGPFMGEGDILGHEPMGIVEEVGADVPRSARRRPGRHPVQHLVRPLLHVRRRVSTRSARPPRTASSARARRCSATPGSTARCRAARPSTCGCPKPSSAPSRCRRARPTTASSTCPTCCPPRGRPSSTRGVAARRQRSSCWASARSVRCAPGWRVQRGHQQRDRHRRRTRTHRAGPPLRRHHLRPRPTATTSSRPSAISPTGAVPTPSSTRSAWRPTARRSASSPTR